MSDLHTLGITRTSEPLKGFELVCARKDAIRMLESALMSVGKAARKRTMRTKQRKLTRGTGTFELTEWCVFAECEAVDA